MESSTKKCTFHFRQVAMTKQCSWMKTSAQPWNMDFHPLAGGAWALTGLQCSWPTPTTSRRCSSSQPWSLKIKGRKKSLQRSQRCNHPLNPFSAFMIMILVICLKFICKRRCSKQFFSHKSLSYHKPTLLNLHGGTMRMYVRACWREVKTNPLLGGGVIKSKVGIGRCPLQGSFFSQFEAENSKRHGVYLQKKGPPSAIYNFNLYGQNARFGGFSTFS